MHPLELDGAPDGVVVSLVPVSAESVDARRRDARVAAVRMLAEAAGVDGSAVSVTARCPACGGDHGGPRAQVAGVPAAVSVSHPSPGVAVVAVSATVVALGVDAEPATTSRERRRAIDELLPGAGDALERWTRTEAVLKADGRGLAVDPASVSFEQNADSVVARVPGDPRSWRVLALRPPGLVVSLAVPAPAGTRATGGGTATDAAR